MKMRLTAIEIDGNTYPVLPVGTGDDPCGECALCDLCGHDGILGTWLERLCADAVDENSCFMTE